MVIVAASDLHRLFSAFAPLTRNPTLPFHSDSLLLSALCTESVRCLGIHYSQ